MGYKITIEIYVFGLLFFAILTIHSQSEGPLC